MFRHEIKEELNMGLYSNIHKKREAGKTMRKKGAKGAPAKGAFKRAALTAKKPKKRMA